ncbi:hypothetical protein F0562_007325 [Nyssa sinensis]|uniref:C2 NT-type domain-containing protein n=1 Tax=Nyssa sinensis TaxID=561372 RepID=A0A5J5A4S8_9ASTE|nr:hypothetical protein F0562_007325 [Nyssa sinensis]
MVTKMMKWSPWPPAAATRKFQVKAKPWKLEGFDINYEEDGEKDKVMAIEMKWKGGTKPGLVPFHRTLKHRKDISSEKIVKKGESIEWDDDDDGGFENVCSFSIISKDNTFGPWVVSFRLLYGEKAESKAVKLPVIGRASLNLGELASKMEYSLIEIKLPINLRGITSEATLSVSMSFVEIRNFQDSIGIVQNSTESNESVENEEKQKRREDGVGLGESDESGVFDSEGMSENELVDGSRNVELSSLGESGPSPGSETRSDPARKVGFLTWKRRRLSSKQAKMKPEPLIKTTGDKNDETKNNVDRQRHAVDCITSGSGPKVDSTQPSCESEYKDENSTTGNWEVKELISRDGLTKLKASVFFASFHQCSDKAAGESACTALVAVIAHWLQSNQNAMPRRSEFDSLIVEGSSEWRKLCSNATLINQFPDKHFDLETVLQADIRPVAVSREKSFIGFFGPEKFKSLKGFISFDDIWNEIRGNEEEDNEPRIYIVSWNDHFFVLKADADAYYIIDTLGERLFEGCNQAYILKFDNTALMHVKVKEERVSSEEMADAGTSSPKEESEEMICSGKECCREFIKRFLASIPLRELEMEEKKETVSYFSLHQRLQIEFNFISSSSSLSSLSSSATSSTSSLFFE